MARLMSFSVACLMFAALVSSKRMPIPRAVNHPDEQCVLKGYLGACTNLTPENTELNCKNIECAAPLRGQANTHRAMSIGRAAAGTHCARNKICFNGECIDLPGGIRMPTVILEHDTGFTCYRPNSGQVNSRHSG